MGLPKGLITGKTAKLPTSAELKTEPPPTRGLRATTWTLAIPGWMPTPLNKIVTSHYGKAHRMKNKDKEIIGLAAMVYGVPVADRKRKVSLLIVLSKGQRAPDPDALWKSLNDALVHCGSLRQDSHLWVELGPVEYARGERLCTFVTIEEF